MTTAELLERIARTLRDDVAPSVDGEYPKTQAFMAAVVLQKIAREVELGDAHRAADAEDAARLAADLRASTDARLPRSLVDGIAAYSAAPNDITLSQLLTTIWSARGELDGDRFDALLARIRMTLRAQIDRRLKI